MSKIERELERAERMLTIRALWFVAGLLFCTSFFLLFNDHTGMFFGGLYIGILLTGIIVWSRCFGERRG